MADNPAPGWYPDPENLGQLRYWDGQQWTEHRSAQNTPSSPPPPSSPGQWQTGGYGQPAQKVDPWLWQSIVATLVCCLPAGVVGIVFAAQANSAMSAGNWAEAQKKAQQAKTWTLVSVGLGVLTIIGVFMMIAMAGPASFSEFQ